MLIYILYFLFIAFFAIEYHFRPFDTTIPITIIFLLLLFMAGFRSPQVAPDYEVYSYHFDTIHEIDFKYSLFIMEPGFVFLVKFWRLLASQNYAFLIMLSFAFFSLLFKLSIIKKLSINPFLVLLFYFSHYYFLHEMTQIRIGLASSIFFLGIPFYLRGENKRYVFIILIATMFQYSAIFYLFVLLFNRNKFNAYFYFCFLMISLLFAVKQFTFFSFLQSFENTGLRYDVIFKTDGYINIFNFASIVKFLGGLVCIIFIPKKVLLNNPVFLLSLKGSIFSIFLLTFLSGLPSIAFRISDLFGILSMFLFANLICLIPNKKLSIFAMVLLAGCFFYLNVLYTKGFINPYNIIDFK